MIVKSNDTDATIGSDIVRNVYGNDPGKLVACIAAENVEKPPKKKTPPTH